MYRNIAGVVEFLAVDTATGLPKTGDSANITAYVSIDGGTVTALGDTSASELSSTNAKGVYRFDVTAAETNGTNLLFSAKSSTSGIELEPLEVWTKTPPLARGTAQAGAAGTITLAAGESSVTDFFKQARVKIIAGTGIGQARLITAYNGTTKVATLNRNWATNPDNTSIYEVWDAESADPVNVDATISSRSTYAGADTSGTTTLLSRLGSAITLSGGAVTVGTNNDKTGYSLSAAGTQAIWDALTSAFTTAGSIGKWLVDKLDVVLSTRLASSSYTAPDNTSITAIKAKTDNLPAAPAATGDCITASGVRTAIGLASANMDTQLAVIQADTDDLQTRIPAALVGGRIDASVGAIANNAITAASIAADAITDAKVANDVTIASVTGSVGSIATDGITAASIHAAAADKIATAIFKLDLSTLSGEALRSLLNATRKQMNRVKKNTGTTKLEIYKEDDTTVAFYQTYTESSGAIVEVNTD